MDGAWDELADGVYRRRYESLDLNIGVVLGGGGAAVVDTRASHVEARQLLDDVSALTDLPIRWAINTYWHWDHTFGNTLFPAVPIHAHTRAYARLAADGEAAKSGAVGWIGEDRMAEIDEVQITLPNVIFDERLTIDLGGRSIILRYLGRGHTDNDIVVTVTDASVVFAGDLLEESAPPAFSDAFPLSWADTVAEVIELGATTTVPGHGDVMTPGDVTTQHEELTAVAAACGEGLALDYFDPETGPYPTDVMRTAWERAQFEVNDAS